MSVTVVMSEGTRRESVSVPPREARDKRPRETQRDRRARHIRAPGNDERTMIAALARDAKREAEAANERRVLVFAGDRDSGIDAAYDAIEAVDPTSTAIVSTREGFRFEEHRPRSTDELLGRTREVVVLDCHEQFVPNALGRSVGAVDGGGLLVLLTPGLDAWPAIRDRFDDSLAVPPYGIEDVTGRFRERFVGTLRSHPGIAVVSLGTGPDGNDAIERDGLVGSRGDAAAEPTVQATAEKPTTPPNAPPNATFPAAAYEACLTDDQVRAVRAFESLATPGHAVVAEADRGRGKSSAAGIAAGALALSGADVLVTAPAFRNAAEVFARASELIEGSESDGEDGDGDGGNERNSEGDTHRIDARRGGRVRFLAPAEAADLPDDPDAVIVDEAAALPVRLLEGSSTRQRSRSARRSTATRAPVAGSRSGLKSACARARSRFEMCDSTSRSGTRETTRWRRGRRGRSCWTRARRSTRRSRARRSGTRRTDG